MGRRSILAVAVLLVPLAPVTACFSLEPDSAVPEREAGSNDARLGDSEGDSQLQADVADARDDSVADADGQGDSGGDSTLQADVTDGQTDDASDDDRGNPSDFYVGLSPPDAAWPADAGTFPTIHAALDAANASSAPTRTIHVGPGTYSTGESFPLILRDGTSLVGAGSSTIVSGLGLAGIAGPPLSQAVASADVTATIVIGDATKSSTIAHLELLGPQGNTAGSEAIICDRGATRGAGSTLRNTFIDDVTVDGFQIGLNITSSPSPPSRSGCSASVTHSTLENGSYGVVASGWSSSYDGTPLQFVSVALGDGTTSGGNVFQNMHDSPGNIGNGAGLVALDAVTGVTVIGNSFADSDQGIWVVQFMPSDPSSGMDIEQNDVGSLDNAGLQIWGPSIVAKLVGNTFHDISTSAAGALFTAPGIVLQTNGTPVMPAVGLARGNTFFGNDVAVIVRSQGVTALAPSVDFGTAADSGRNVFRCNVSPVTTGNGDGGDILVDLPGATGVVLPFEGNVWDHAPPHVAPAGDDITIVHGAVALDTADAGAADSPPCPAGRGPGP